MTRIQRASRGERIKTAEEDQQNEDDNIIRVDIPGITTDESASMAGLAQPSTKKKGTVTKTYGGKSKARNMKHAGNQNDNVSKDITTGGEAVDVGGEAVDVVERHHEGNPAQKGKGKTTSVVVVVSNDKDNAAEGGSQCTRAPHPTATAGTSGSAHTAIVASPQEPEGDVQTSETNGHEQEPCPATSYNSSKPKDHREKVSPSTTTTRTTTTTTSPDGSPSQPASPVVASSELLHPSTPAAPLKQVHDDTSLPSAGTFRILHIHCACLLTMLFQLPRMSNHQTKTLNLTGICPRAAILSPKRATTSRILLQCPRIIGTVGLMTYSTSTLINGVDVVILDRLTCHPPPTALRREL